jgi:tricorn protease
MRPNLVQVLILVTALALPSAVGAAQGELGYYREPALAGDVLVFVAEGDLWRVPVTGGAARRLTTHAGAELGPAVSPDGRTVAFTARYDGPREVYTMPIEGGRPTRRTFGLEWGAVAGFAPDGRLAYTSIRYSTLPDRQLVLLDLGTGVPERVPLAQADHAAWSADGATLYFTRLPWQGSHCKRYEGGQVQQLWRFDVGARREAVALTADYAGTSKNPMIWKDRLYFLSDRDGTMNVWSMRARPGARDVRQETKSARMDVKEASLSQGRIAYRVGADIRLLDLASGRDVVVPIRLVTDADHTRGNWVEDPMDFLTSAHVAPDGSRVALTTRGHVFTAPVGKGRRIHVPKPVGVRYREASFSADGKRIHLFSDATDEVELWSLPADGSRGADLLTTGSEMMRSEHLTSPDGRYVAHTDRSARLWLLDTKTLVDELVEDRVNLGVDHLSWSPDSRWLVYRLEDTHVTGHHVLKLRDTKEKMTADLTTVRYPNASPVFGRGGKWLYFLSERNLESLARSPWGPRGPEPYFDRRSRIYALALQPGLRPPFQEPDEVWRAKQEAEKEAKPDEGKKDEKKETENGEKKEDAGKGGAAVEIALEGIRERFYELPIPPGNYDSLVATKGHLLWLAADDPHARSRHGGTRQDLRAVALGEEKVDVETRMRDVESIELSADGKKLMVRAGKSIHVIPADSAASVSDKALEEARVDLSGWTFAVDPRAEWRQMYEDAWRMHRDWFYDPGMHGVDWDAMRLRYAPLVDRVRDRLDLDDVTGMLISELSALHASVGGGELRRGTDDIDVGCLGARFVRSSDPAGFRIEHVFVGDPDEPSTHSPLSPAHLGIREGDVVVRVNQRAARSAPEIGALLLDQVGRQVRLDLVRPAQGDAEALTFAAIVKPISMRAERSLRYGDWEYTRRLQTERLGKGRIGYMHLRTMGARDMAQFVRDFYPVFHREGLILDVRHNGGGNIDAWLLSRLIRKAWMYWHGRTGKPLGNMHYAPHGHMIVLCDEHTASDGEALCDGFQRLGLGPVLGTRTWGGEIWLSRSNRLVDRGVASAGQWGVFGLDGTWLVEGRGVEPDIVVDNLPHETFGGRDRQLEAAIHNLFQRLEAEPRPWPAPPPFPDKSVPDNR